MTIQPSLSTTDPLLSRARELLLKELPELPTLWVKPPGDTPPHLEKSAFYHPWYPEHSRLLQKGWREFSARVLWPQVTVFGGKQKEENRRLIAAGGGLLAEGGRLYFVLPNDYGAKSFQKDLEKNGVLTDCFVGRKSRLLVLGKQAAPDFGFADLIKNRAGFWSAPGLFGWDKVDRGSQLLLECLKQQNLKGPIADLGAGWGYLAQGLPPEQNVHLFEADIRGLEAAKKNLVGHSATYHWCDVTTLSSATPQLSENFRTVITNPPFHTSRNAEPVLGGAFVAMAERILKPRGRLYLVGNSHLPYPKIMGTYFHRVDILDQKDGFTVLQGQKS